MHRYRVPNCLSGTIVLDFSKKQNNLELDRKKKKEKNEKQELLLMYFNFKRADNATKKIRNAF